MTEEILQINENFSIDESIEEYEFVEHPPESGDKNLNSGVAISIVIDGNDRYTHPHASYLLIKGNLMKQNGQPYTDADEVTLCNNGIMHLFEHISYKLSGQEIEYIMSPGQITTMIGLLKYSSVLEDDNKNFLWCKDKKTSEADSLTNTGFAERRDILIKYPDSKGSFSFCIPLKHLFGFADDYDKIVYGFKHQLTLKRNSDADAIFRKEAVDPGKITLNNITWFMPYVEPALEQKVKLYKMIENKSTFNVGYRARQCESILVPQAMLFTWKLSTTSSPEAPRWIIIAFQTRKSNDQTKNASVFDHIDIRNIYVTLNAKKYPQVDYNLSFTNQDFSRAHRDATSFLPNFYGIDATMNKPKISPHEFKNLYPLFVFDVSKQKSKLQYSSTGITVTAFFNKTVPAETHAYAVVISDRILKFQSDGNKMAVVRS